MTAVQPGDPFHLDLEGTLIDGRILEVDPPHRLLVGWEHPGSDAATSVPALAEITLTPAAEADSLRRYFLGYQKLPVTLIVDETPFTVRADGRRMAGEIANPYPMLGGAMLVGPDGKLLRVLDGIDPKGWTTLVVARALKETGIEGGK